MKILRSIHVTSPNITCTYPDELAERKFDAHSWPFRIEKGWTYVNEIEKADIVPFMIHSNDFNILNRMSPNQIAVGLSIFHIAESLHADFYMRRLEELRKLFPFVFIVHKNSDIKNVDGLIHYDCMFNRAKLYYTEYEKIKKIVEETGCEQVWTMGTDERNYTIPPLRQKQPSDKIFINPGLVYGGLIEPRMRYRTALKEYLTKKYNDLGYISRTGDLLLPEPCSENNKRWMNSSFEKGGGYWLPIGNSYYEKTYLSIYVETLTVSDYPTRCITEKTFDPLIKGHFILPFAYAGFIKDLKDFGFKFPDFIDYSYDEIKDNDKRFSVYLYCIDKVMSKSWQMHELFEKYRDILHYNRNIFFTRPYDTLYDKIKSEMYRLHYKATNHSSNL